LDYIIFGLGVGATLTLTGWAFRVWGPALRDRTSSTEESVLSGYELVNRMAWQRFCRSCGAVLAMFGLLVLAVTIIATILTFSNSTGSIVVLATFAVCLVATLIWLGLFLHRFGSRGIFRPPIAQPDSVPAAASPGPASPASVSSRYDGPVRQGGSSVSAASENQPDTVDVAMDTAGVDAPLAIEPSDEELEVSDETSDELGASKDEHHLEDEGVLFHEEEPWEVEGETGVDAGDDGHPASLGSSEPVERPVEEDAEMGRLVFRSAAGEEPPSVESSAVPGGASDLPREDSPETEGDVSGDRVPVVGRSDATDDLLVEQSPVRAVDDERETTVAQPGLDVPASSGRAEAVRSLRQRRIRRQIQEPPESE